MKFFRGSPGRGASAPSAALGTSSRVVDVGGARAVLASSAAAAKPTPAPEASKAAPRRYLDTIEDEEKGPVPPEGE